MTAGENFSFQDNPSKIFQKKDEEKVREVNLVIDKIKELSPISIWDLSKELPFSNSKLYYLIRDLEFAGVIYTKIRLNENNRASRIIYISSKSEVQER